LASCFIITFVIPPHFMLVIHFYDLYLLHVCSLPSCMLYTSCLTLTLITINNFMGASVLSINFMETRHLCASLSLHDAYLPLCANQTSWVLNTFVPIPYFMLSTHRCGLVLDVLHASRSLLYDPLPALRAGFHSGGLDCYPLYRGY